MRQRLGKNHRAACLDRDSLQARRIRFQTAYFPGTREVCLMTPGDTDKASIIRPNIGQGVADRHQVVVHSTILALEEKRGSDSGTLGRTPAMKYESLAPGCHGNSIHTVEPELGADGPEHVTEHGEQSDQIAKGPAPGRFPGEKSAEITAAMRALQGI